MEAKANLKNGTVGKWRESIPRADSLRKVAKVLHVSMETLMKEPEKGEE